MNMLNEWLTANATDPTLRLPGSRPPSSPKQHPVVANEFAMNSNISRLTPRCVSSMISPP